MSAEVTRTPSPVRSREPLGSWTYDDHERLESIGNGDVVYAFTYDANDRLETLTDSRVPTNPIVYQRNAAGRLTQKTDYLGEDTTYLYDGTGRLTAETKLSAVDVSYQYDGAGRVLSRILSNGARTAYGYDAAGRLEFLGNWTADGTLLEQVNVDSRDPVGNVTQATTVRADGTTEITAFDYDALHRLEEAVYTVDSVEVERQNFTYDAIGNRKTFDSTASGIATRYYLYECNHQLSEIRLGSETGAQYKRFEYDPDGRLTIRRDAADQVELFLERDDRGRVSRVEVSGSEVASYAYDPFGYRIEEVLASGTRQRLLEGEHLEALLDGSGAPLAAYQRGAVIDEVVNAYHFDGNGTPTSYTYHHDDLQSVVGLSGHAGTVEETLRYGPFGDLISRTGSSPSALRFTGRELDAGTGLYYYRARYYDPEIGRFLSEDPLGFGGGDVNLYAYVGNNPLRFNDPRGEVANLIAGAGGAIIGGIAGGITAFVKSDGQLGATLKGASSGALVGGFAGLTFGASTALSGGAVFAKGAAIGFVAGAGGNAAGQFFGNDGVINLVEVGAVGALSAVPGGLQGSLSRYAATLGLGDSTLNTLASLGVVAEVKIATGTLGAAITPLLPEFNVDLGNAYNLVDQLGSSMNLGTLGESVPAFEYPSINTSAPIVDAYCKGC